MIIVQFQNEYKTARIVEFEYFKTKTDGKIFHRIYGSNANAEYIKLGEYTTQERAIEVYEQMNQFITYKYQEEQYRIAQNNYYDFAPELIYKMPEE